MRLLFLLMLFCLPLTASSDKVFHYYCTAADERHFPQLLNLIGSIHKNDFDNLDQIAVFDLGLNLEQKTIVERMDKTQVYSVEMVNPKLLTYFVTSPQGRSIRGWFAWKPVIFKQTLEMFPYAVYLDAGSLVLNSPNDLFKHIKENGHFLLSIAPHTIESVVTQTVRDKVLSKLPQEQQTFLLKNDTWMIDGGFQGISRSLGDTYVTPMYKLASDLSVFADDGTSKGGFGNARHDQTLFSIYAQMNRLAMNDQGWSNLKVDGKAVPFHMHWDRSQVNDKTTIYRSRGDYTYGGNKTVYIHWRNPI